MVVGMRLAQGDRFYQGQGSPRGCEITELNYA